MMLKLAGHVPTSSFPFVPGGAAFLAAVVPDISQMIDLNESCKHTLAGHSTHQEIFTCDVQSVVPYLLPELK